LAVEREFLCPLRRNDIIFGLGLGSCKNIIFKKNPPKETKNPSRYYNSRTNLKFEHKTKYYLSKILI
jgi:hypothetical protein